MHTASVIGSYAALGSEADPADAMAIARARGAAIAYPVVQDEPRTMHFRRVDDVAELAPGAFGVPTPDATHPQVPLSALDIILIPGLAFDRRGYRLGWGKAYYDNTLPRARGLRVAFAFQQQVVERVPISEHDVPVHYLVTDTGIERCGVGAMPPGHPAPETNSPPTD